MRSFLEKRNLLNSEGMKKSSLEKRGDIMPATFKRPIDEKCVVLPIFGALIHDYAYEGPCRFGGREELTHEFDEMAANAGYKATKEKIAKRLASEDIEILDMLFVSNSDEFNLHEEVVDKIEALQGTFDVILIEGNPMPFWTREIYTRFKCPILIHTDTGAITVSEVSDAHNRGYDNVYGCVTLTEAKDRCRAVKAMKALAHTRTLKMIRHESNLYLTDDFEVAENYGVMARSINLHEVIDQLTTSDGHGNPSLPERKAYNLTPEEDAEAEKIADELLAGAEDVLMKKEELVKSVRFNILTRKLMKHFGCNSFTAQCKECCATTRLNHEHVTYCLGHSLNNEAGIPSACEGDMNALHALVVMMCLSHKAPYQSNTTPVVIDEDGEIEGAMWFAPNKCMGEYPNQLYCTWHATPNRYMHGFDEDPDKYGIGPFAANAGFGGTIRYKFEDHQGEEITLMRFNPAGTKMLVFKSKIVGGTGYDRYGCPEGPYFPLKDRDGAFKAQNEFGDHTALVYGDYRHDLKILAEMMGIEYIEFTD